MEQSSRIRPGLWYRLADGGLFLLLATAAFTLGCQELFDADVWWHLRAGQWILANGKVPRVDPFTFGSADRPWIDVQWLFEVILAAVFTAGRVRAIVVMTAVVATSVLLVALMARDKRWPSWVVAACWLPALTAMSARFLPRPESLSLLAMSVYLTVLRRTDTTPALAWLLPLVQVFWVNVHALFVLGPFLLSAYLIDRFTGTIWNRSSGGERATPEARRKWWIHVGGATVAVGLACLANPYGLQGVFFPLELFPKITAWGGTYKSYIAEFSDLRVYVQNQSTESAAGNPFVQADCFLLWMLPLSFIVPTVWRIGGAVGSRATGSVQAIGWLLAFGSAAGLILTSVLGLPGARSSWWLIRSAELVPLGLLALGAMGAVLIVRASRQAALLALFGSTAEAAWVVWVRLHLFGGELGLPTWLSASDALTVGYTTLFLGVVTAGLLLRGGERPFRLALAVVFGYLALQAIRNINLFGLAAGFVLSWSLGEWVAELLDRVPLQQGRLSSYAMAGLAARAIVFVLIGAMIFTIVSGPFFRSTGERRRFGTIQSPLAYAHEAARFAGRPGLPDHALVFSLAQAGVYLYHNSPDRKPFLDGRLEVASQATFESYVRLNQQLQMGGKGWSDVLRQMGDPLILLDHERNFGGEATLLVDREWRCVYYDAIASVFLARRRRDLEAAFPSVDFAARHFRDPAWRAIPPEPWGLREAWVLHNMGSTLRLRSAAAADSVSRLQFALALLVCDRVHDALALDPANVSHWCLLGHSCWNMVGALRLTAPVPGGFWEPVRGLLPAQAAFCYRRALEINPGEPDALRPLSQAFQALRLSDAQRSLDSPVDRARHLDRVTSGSDEIGATDQRRPRRQVQDEPPTLWRGDGPDGLSRVVSSLLQEGRAEAATRLFAEAENRGVRAGWATCDRVATTLLHLGRPAEARRIWESTTDPPSPALRLAHIAASELAAMDFPTAERSYQAARALDPGLGETWLGLALLYTERGDPAEALTASREGLRRALTPEQKSFLRFVEALAAPYAPHP
jgi:tetratricopeptide (TPR) repeat protein